MLNIVVFCIMDMKKMMINYLTIIRFYSAFKPFSDRPLIEQQISPLLCLL